MQQHLTPPSRIGRRTLAAVLLSVTTVSCTSILTVEPEPADRLTAEQLNARIAQSERSIYYQCQGHTLAVYDGSLYRKQGARSYALLSEGMEHGVFRWGANGETNEFNPVTKIEVVRSKGLVDRFECQAASFYDPGQRLAIARDRFPRPEREPSAKAGQGERRESLRTKKKARAKPPAMAKTPSGSAENPAAEAKATTGIQPSQGTNGANPPNAAPKPGAGMDAGASPAQGQTENAAPAPATEPKADAQGMNKPEENQAGDGRKKAEPSTTAEPSASTEKPGWLAWLRRRLGWK